MWQAEGSWLAQKDVLWPLDKRQFSDSSFCPLMCPPDDIYKERKVAYSTGQYNEIHHSHLLDLLDDIIPLKYCIMSRSIGLLAQAEQKGVVSLVGINKVKFVPFPKKPTKGQICSAGIRQLSACSVVIVVSELGAIVAHIGPNEEGATEPNSYLRLTWKMMNNVARLYQDNSRCFSESTRPFVVVATFEGSIVVPEQVDIMVSSLMEIKLVPQLVKRPIQPAVDDSSPEGTILVLGGSSTFKVFVEDEVLTNTTVVASSGNATSMGYASNTSAASSSSEAPSETWYFYEGREGYYLMRPDGTCVQHSETPPPFVLICRTDAQYNPVSWAMWDGNQWQSHVG